MQKQDLKQIVYLTYLTKGYPKSVTENHTEEAYQEKLSKAVDTALGYASTGLDDSADLGQQFPGLSPEDVSLNDQLIDAALEYMFVTSAYAWNKERTTSEYRRMIYDSKKRIITSLVRSNKRIFGTTMLIRHFEDEKFEKLIRYELEMSDKNIRMTCLPWYDMKPFYSSANAYKLMKKKQDYVSLPSEYEFEGTEEEHTTMMRMGGAMCLLSYIIDALVPTPEPRKKKPMPKKNFNKKPYTPGANKQQKPGGYQQNGSYQKRPYNPDYQRRPYNNNNSSTRYKPRYEKVGGSQRQELGPNGQPMRHRRQRIQRPPTDTNFEMPSVDSGTTKL